MRYTARFGPTWHGVLLLVLSLAALGAALTEPQMLQRIPIIVVCSAATVIFTLVICSGRVALGVDEQGVVLGGHPLVRYEATTERIPWQDIEEIVLFRLQLRYTSLRYIGIQRQPGLPAASPAMPAKTTTRAVIEGLRPGVVFTCRPISGWRLDLYQLEETVARHGPHVTVRVAQARWRSRWRRTVRRE